MRFLISALIFAAAMSLEIAWGTTITSLVVTATLTWENTDVRPEVKGSRIEVEKGDGKWLRVYTVNRDVKTGVLPSSRIVAFKRGETWCYRVRSFTVTGQSKPSNQSCATIPEIESVQKP
jgi:hypothetical protein